MRGGNTSLLMEERFKDLSPDERGAAKERVTPPSCEYLVSGEF